MRRQRGFVLAEGQVLHVTGFTPSVVEIAERAGNALRYVEARPPESAGDFMPLVDGGLRRVDVRRGEALWLLGGPGGSEVVVRWTAGDVMRAEAVVIGSAGDGATGGGAEEVAPDPDAPVGGGLGVGGGVLVGATAGAVVGG